jgi:hypothetical protein
MKDNRCAYSDTLRNSFVPLHTALLQKCKVKASSLNKQTENFTTGILLVQESTAEWKEMFKHFLNVLEKVVTKKPHLTSMEIFSA